MIFIAHRGFRVGVVENTFEAFNKATELEMDYIELDVHLSKDGILYVIHDSGLERTMNATGRVEDMSSEDLDHISTKKNGFKLPRLSAVIKELLLNETGTGPRLMIELKGKSTAKPVCKLIKRYNIQQKIVFSGRYLPELKVAHAEYPSIPVCLNITKCKKFTLADLMRTSAKEKLPIPFSMISLKSTMIKDGSFIEKCHLLNIKALSWHFMEFSNESFTQMKRLFNLKIDGLLLDDPASVQPLRTHLKI